MFFIKKNTKSLIISDYFISLVICLPINNV